MTNYKEKDKHIINMLPDEKIIEEIVGFIRWAVDRGSITEKQREKSDLWITWLEKQKGIVEEYEDKLDRCACKSFDKGYKAATEKVDAIENFDTEFEKQVSHLIASAINKEHEYNEDFVKWTANVLLNYAKQELEKQGEHKGLDYPYVAGWRKNYKDNKPKVKHSVLMLTTHGIAEGEWLGEEWCQYRWSCKVKDTEVLYWMHLSDLENLEKENEKQGEQKPTNKVEPKFKVGDWITDDGRSTFQILKIENEYYITDDGDKVWIKLIDKHYQLWTIQDANDGDVLVVNNEIFIYAHRKQMYSIAVAQCFVDSAGGFYLDGEFGYTEKGNSIHPATKEQCDLLFSKMKEAGYEWDAEKKELKKIEQIPANSSETCKDERKPAENNEKVSEYITVEKDMEEYNKGFECGKQRVLKYPEEFNLCEKSAWKPSDEQMEALWDSIPENVKEISEREMLLDSLYQDLKKLR